MISTIKRDLPRYLTFVHSNHEILSIDFNSNLQGGGLYIWSFDSNISGYDLDEHFRSKIIGVDIV